MRLSANCLVKNQQGNWVPGTCYGEYPDGSFVSSGSCPAGFQQVPFSGAPADGGMSSDAGAYVCVAMPKAPAPAQSITVSPNIAVSPQISPNFIQQMQPQNSGVTAGAAQIGSGGASSAPPASSGASSAPPTSSGLTQADVQAQIDAALALDRANRAASVGTVIPQNSAGVPSLAVPAYTPPAYNGGDPVGGAIVYAGSPAQSAVVPQSTTPQSTTPPDRTMLYVGFGAAALLLFLLSKPRRA